MVIEMDLLPPRWVDVQEEVSEHLADIAQKSSELDKLHQKHLLPGFGDEDVRRRDEGTIERLTQDITRGFHDSQKAIQRIEMMVREQAGVTSGEETMAKNIQISLAQRVQEASARFRKKQSTYLRSMIRPIFYLGCYHEELRETNVADLRRNLQNLETWTASQHHSIAHLHPLKILIQIPL